VDNNNKDNVFQFGKKDKPKKEKKPKEKKPKKDKKKLSGKIIALIVVVVILLFISLVTFFTDLLWFDELGYLSVFLKKLITILEIGVPTFIIMTGLSYIYFKHIRKNYYKSIATTDFETVKKINLISGGLAAIFGCIITYFAASQLWFKMLQFSNSSSFGKTDPMFGHDISFYVFRLDFISEVVSLIIVVLVVFIIMTLIYYLMLMNDKGPKLREYKPGENAGADFSDFDREKNSDPFTQNIGDDNPFNRTHGTGGKFGNVGDMFSGAFGGAFNPFGNNQKSRPAPKKTREKSAMGEDEFKELFEVAKKQLIIVGVIFFIMLGVHFLLKSYTLLSAHTGAVYGAGWTDVHITLNVYRILMVLSFVGALGVIYGIVKKKPRQILTVPVIMICVGLIGVVASAVVQNFVVSPDEISKESKYLERNIEYTQAAYGLNNVDVKSFSATGSLTAADIKANDQTIQNIRINDYKPAEKFYNQTQSIRQYYDFADIDVDRYIINGKKTQVFLSPREINEDKISDTWLNKHLKYTHGYGLTISRVDKITASGQPDMLLQDIPPVSDINIFKITRPEVYFGQMTNDYLVVGTDEDEFNYPDGDANKYTRYEGSAGINMTPLNRVLFAMREHSLKLLVSSNIDSQSKIVINRNIKKRVQTIMPYLRYDKDPYMVTVKGKLYWIIDAYTQSSNYPYSEPYSTGTSTNYIKNSIKVVIDAYSGDTDYYIIDSTDPIAQTYKKIYPKLFKDFNEMPAALQAHIRYPNTLFDIQARVYEKYHMNDVKVFYQKEDMWAISDEIYGTDEQEMEPNYYTLSLPGKDEDSVEFVNSIPYTPKDKKNLTGLLIARNDGKNYGQLVLYKLPKDKVVYGPMQIEAQIDQSTEISKEFSLWNSSGSTYSRGNLFVVPINDSLLYVEPIYLEATNSSIPEVKRVVVAYHDQIAYESTLGAALESLFGDGAGTASSNSGKSSTASNSKAMTRAEIIQNAQDYYDKAQSAAKSGNWADYGKYMKKLKNMLDKLG
jgi:Uncharacterized conserved protein